MAIMSKTRLVVFDMAGTTVKDIGAVPKSFINAFRKYDMEISKEEVKRVMGYKKVDAIKMLLDRFHAERINSKQGLAELIHQSFEKGIVDLYTSDNDLKSQPHAEEIFSWLRQHDIRVALNTGFTRVITDAILYKLNWKGNEMIDEVISSDEVEEGRPSPLMIQELRRRLKVGNANEVMKVGDTEVDVKEGRNAQCGVVVSVTTGAYSREQLQTYQPDFIIDNLSEIRSIIK